MKSKKCLNPTCGRIANARGLCNSCYGTAARLIRENKTTWAILESQGKAHPAYNNRRYRGTIDWLLDQKTAPKESI